MSSRVTALTVESSSEPVGIDVLPRFGWITEPAFPGDRQVAYRLRVIGPTAMTWDSGLIRSEQSFGVEYAGDSLAPLTHYEWSVEVQTTSGHSTSQGTFVTGMLDGEWHGAEWLSHPTADGAAPLLRHEFVLRNRPERAWLVVAAGGYARVTLNEKTATADVLTPGFTDYDETVQYTVTEVTRLLDPGVNAIGVELGRGFFGLSQANTWNWETAPWHAEPCVRMLLVIDGPDGRRFIGTGEGWKAIDGPTRYDDVYGGETFDASKSERGFDGPTHPDSHWSAATVAEGPRGRLVHQRQPGIQRQEEFQPTKISELEPGVWIVEFPRAIAGWVRVHTDVSQTVELRYGEKIGPDGTPRYDDEFGYYANRFQTDIAQLTADEGTWEPRFSWKGFRFVEVRAESLPEVSAVLVHTSAERTGSFSGGSELLEMIHELTVRTVLNNLHGLPTDTPKFEKNGWTGDGMLGAEFMLMNLDLHELLAKWVDDIAQSRHDGPVPAVIAPHGGWALDWSPAPTWHAAYVLVPYYLYLYCGDTRVLREHWAGMSDYVRFECERSPGGIADTTLGDWMSPETMPTGGNAPEDKRVSATAYLHASLTALAQIASAIGEDPAPWIAEASRVRAAFQHEFVDAELAVVRGKGDEGFRQTHAVLSLAFGLLPLHLEQRVADGLAGDIRARGNHLGTGVLGTKYLLPQLTRMGYGELAVAVAQQVTYPSWGHWVANGATSLWEHWSPDARSHGHYFFGTIDDWLYHDVAGLRPLEPGWRRTRVAPAVTAFVSHAAASVPTPYGTLSIDWRRDDTGIHAVLSVPVGITAEVSLGDVERNFGSGVHRISAGI